jgi:hypothetical protein
MLMETIQKNLIFVKGKWSLEWKEVFVYTDIWFIQLIFFTSKKPFKMNGVE